MSRVARAAKTILSNPALFSHAVLRLPLYDYQLTPLIAVVDSVLNCRGLDFLCVFPRQSGKNEAGAHLIVYLLNLFQRVGGSIVFGATGDGLGRGIRRLDERLDNVWNHGQWLKGSGPTSRRLGNASVRFLSTHPSASSRGETASLLLIIDELQDQEPNHLDAVFEPMRAANNATALYLGTVRTTHDALWQKKKQLEALTESDGIPRVFMVYPDAVIASNPSYGLHLDSKIQRFGLQHPIVSSEYFNVPIDSSAALFDSRRRNLMVGSHPPLLSPAPGVMYVATLDVAGIDESPSDPLQQLTSPGRDYTAATIFSFSRDLDSNLIYQAIAVFLDHGTPHFQDGAGPSLATQLLAFLHSWQVSCLISDATGVGAGLTDWFVNEFSGFVYPFVFNRRSKAELGARFISLIETNRFKYFDDGRLILSDTWWLITQAANCSYDLKIGGQFDRDLRWFVPPSAKVSTPLGPKLIHDDRLISAALIAYFDELAAEGKVNTGRAYSQVIDPIDPVKEVHW